MSAKYKSPSFLLPNELNTSANSANDTGINSLYSIKFNGTSSYIIADSIDITGNKTLSMWFKTASVGTSQGLFEIMPTPNTSDYLAVWIYQSKILAASDGTYPNSKISSTLSNNTWYHLVVEKSAGVINKIYINGVDDTNTASASLGFVTGRNNLYIGAGYVGTAYAVEMNGHIDEVAIFNRSLNTTEISALYDGSGSNIRPSNLMATDLGPIAYYPLGEQAQMQGYLGNEASSEWQFPNGVLQDYVMDFDSASPGDYVSLGDLTTVESNEFTISMWVNKDNIATNSVLFNSGTAAAPNDSVIFQHTGSTFYIGVGGAGGSTLSAGLSSGVWYNFILTVNGTTAKVYIDGSQFGSNITVGSVRTGIGSEAVLGKYNFGTFANLDGKMSNVAIWNTDQSANIANIYNNGSPQTTYTVTPQNWWKLNADSVYTPSAPNYTKALDFTGTQHIKSVGTRSFNNFSISFWFNTATTPSAFEGYISGQTGTGNDYSLGGFSIYYYNGGLALQSSNVNFNLSFTNNITLGNWNHIVVDIDNSNSSTGGKLYLNGQLALEVTNSGAYTYNFNNLWIGSRSTSGGNATNLLSDSKVSNVSVFNSNLTASQVSTLFNFGTPETITSFSPYNHYKLNNNTTGIQDSGSAGNNAVITGTLNSVNSSVAVVPSWKIPSALPIPTINYTTALDFNRSEYDNLNTTPVTDFDTGDVSFSVWVFKDDGSTTGLVFNNSYNSGKAGITVGISDLERVLIKRSTRTHLKSTGYRNFGFTTNKWHQIAFTYDDSTYTLRTFLDGQFKEEWSVPSGTLAASTTVCVGGREPGSGNASLFFDGKISNLTIFKSKLEDSDINTLYNSGQPLSDLSSFTTLATWWKLDNLTTGIQDSAGSINLTNDGATQVTSDVYAENIPVNGVSTTLPSTALQQSDLQFDSPYSNYSLSFDGTTSVSMDFTNTSAKGSVSVWVKPTDYTTGQQVIWCYNGSGNRDYIGLFQLTSGVLGFETADNGTNKWRVATTSAAVSNNTWTHLLCTFDGSNAVIYVNGVAVPQSYTITSDTTYWWDDLIPTNQRLGILSVPGYSTGQLYNGSMDENTVWNTNLTEAQVLEIYNNGRPKDLTTFSGTAPISWWRLGENAYFQDSTLVLPNSIIGAPNGEASTNNLEMISADAPGTYANGIGTNLAILDRVGDAPLSTSNSQSYNMIPSDKIPYVPGYVGLQTNNIYSMSFNGTDEYFDAGNPTELQLTGAFSVSLWMKTIITGSRAFVAKDNNASNPRGFKIGMNNTNNGGYFIIHNGTTSYGVYVNSSHPNYVNIRNNNWHHIVGVYTPSTSIALFIDGNLIESNTTNIPASVNFVNDNLNIGRIPQSGGTNYYQGELDEVAIFDKALNAEQIFNDLYQPTATATNKTADLVNNPNLPTPVAWYRMGD